MNFQGSDPSRGVLFKYDVQTFKVPASEGERDWWVRTLNELAEQGWEISQCLRLKNDYILFIFKQRRFFHG